MVFNFSLSVLWIWHFLFVFKVFFINDFQQNFDFQILFHYLPENEYMAFETLAISNEKIFFYKEAQRTLYSVK